MMSMIGKLDALMYATNHAEETARNLKKAGEWLKSKASSLPSTDSSSSSPSPSSTVSSPSASANVPSSTVDAGTTAAPAAAPTTSAATPANHGFVSWFMNDASMVDKMVLALVVILAAIAVIMIVKRAYTALTTPVDASAVVSSARMNDAHGFNVRGLTGHVNAHDVMDTAVDRRNTNVR